MTAEASQDWRRSRLKFALIDYVVHEEGLRELQLADFGVELDSLVLACDFLGARKPVNDQRSVLSLQKSRLEGFKSRLPLRLITASFFS